MTRTCWRPGRRQGRDAWDVRLFHRGVCTDGGDGWAGTSQLEVTGDTLDLTTFHDLVCEQAAQLKALGDTDTLEVRKAKAVGVIANRQAALDLDHPALTAHAEHRDRPGRRARLVAGPWRRPSSTCTCP